MNTTNTSHPQPTSEMNAALNDPQLQLFHQRELFRHAILLQLEAAQPASLPLETLYHGLKLTGYSIAIPKLESELQYLEDKSLLKRITPTLSSALFRFQLTAQGRDYLESQGLA